MSTCKPITIKSSPLQTAQRSERSSTPNKHILRSIQILTCFTGNTKKQEYKVLAYFGAILWSISVTINLSFAFYEGFAKISAMGVVISSAFLLNCIICTFGVNLRCAPWIEKGVYALSNSGNFKRTIRKTNIIGKKLLIVTPLISSVLTALYWLCSYYDNSTDLQLVKALPSWSAVILSSLHLFSQFHVIFAYVVFWSVLVFVSVLILFSVQDYKEYIKTCLLNKKSSLTFREAVVTFNERARFVSKGSSACMITSTSLFIHSVSSFSFGVYAFLYHKRQMTYIFHAVVPLLSAIYPMTLAASVTKEYQSYVQDVVKAWVERPESDDDDEEKPTAQRLTPTLPVLGRNERLRGIWKNTARAVGMFQVAKQRPKFQFEKYIAYLQNVSLTTGFRVAGIVITWNKMSTLFFLLFSIMAVFVQESIFGNAKSTIS